MLTWWEKLGLSVRADRRDASETERKKVMARARMLERFRPVQFEADGERIDLDELAVRLEVAVGEVELALMAEAEDRRARGWSHLLAAYEAPDADDVLADGVWAGFTKARARAWLGNLAQYEPFDFSPMFSARRREREAAIEAGKIVEVPRYADRARHLEAAGMTPHDYRRAQEALGRPIFSEGQVSSGSCECGEV